MLTIFAIVSIAAVADPGGGGEFGELRGGGGVDPHGPCVSVAERQAAEVQVQLNRIALGLVGGPRAAPGGTAYRFWPQGGTMSRDLFMNNFVDLNSGAGILDYACSNWTYNGHAGHDMDIRSFSEQTIGVPIFAAADGTVVGRADGNFDMNTSAGNQPANYVIIDHGGGHLTYSWHMKNGSVAVNVGNIVRAGQQIGLTGSSGSSTAPHLHFETGLNGNVYEAWAGGCRAGASGWVVQPEPDRSTVYFIDFGFTRTNLGGYAGPPTPFPRSGHAALTDGTLYYWIKGANLPTGSTTRWVFVRPNGTVAFDSGTFGIGFSTQFHRWYWMYTSWNIADMHTITGTWKVRVFINGAQIVEAPIEVRATVDASFNRAPNAAPVSFDPSAPKANDVIFCRVGGSLVLDDPDYDVVSYRYVWRVNGSVVRDVVSAGMADAIARDTAVTGDTLECVVTPRDATLNGPSSTISVIVGQCGPADIGKQGGIPGADGVLDNNDFVVFINHFFAADPRADFGRQGGIAPGDGAFDNNDFVVFINLFFGGC